MKKSCLFMRIMSVILCVIMLLSSNVTLSFASEVATVSTASSTSSLGDFFEELSNLFKEILKLIYIIFGVDSPEKIDGITVCDGSLDTEKDSAFYISCVEFDYYLYLPAYVNISELVFNFDSSKNVKINNEEIKSGEKVKLDSDDKEFKLKINSKSYNVEIMQSANIPSLMINTESGSMDYIHESKNNRETGELVMVSQNGSVEYDNSLDYVKGRGNSSWKYAKKGYNIKLAKSTDLYNLGKTKKWCLVPNQIDKSLLRNQVAYDLADAVGLEYSPSNIQVDLYLNGLYNGTYLLVVKNEIGSAAVDITDLEKATEKVNDKDLDEYNKIQFNAVNNSLALKCVDIPNNPEDITGGYLLELDVSSYGKEVSGFVSPVGQHVVVKSPDYVSKEQIEYIGTWYSDFEEAVYSESGYNSKGKYYTEYIDVESFAKYYLMTEITMNGDTHITSVFMYKESAIDGDGLLHAGPVWDYDSGLGNNGGKKGFDVKVILTNPQQQFCSIAKMYKHKDTDYIYAALYKHKDFRLEVIDCYKNDFVPALNVLLGKTSNSNYKLDSIDNYAKTVTPSANMNFSRWTIMLNNFTGAATGYTYKDNIENLSNFISQKTDFMNKIIDAYAEDYLYIFIEDSNIYGVTSFETNSVELYKGTGKINDTVSHGEKEFTITSKK